MSLVCRERGVRLWACALATLWILGTAAAAETRGGREDERATVARLEQGVKFKKGRFRLQTEHWRIETEVSPRFTAELGRFMELFLDRFTVLTGLLSSRSRVSMRPIVVVFASPARYEKETGLSDTRGLFRPRRVGTGAFTSLEIYTYVDDGSGDFADFDLEVLQHEGTHLLLQKYLGLAEVPSWFTEGLATRFEHWDLRLGAAENEKSCHEATARRVLHGGRFRPVPPIESLLAIDRGIRHDHGLLMTQFNYVASAAFVDFLIASDERKPLLTQIFQRISRGVDSRRLLTSEELLALGPAWKEYWYALHKEAWDR